MPDPLRYTTSYVREWPKGDPILEGMMGREVWYIFGAGASVLDMDLAPLNGEIVYGINWTWKWFWPTFLQVIDEAVYKKMLNQADLWPIERTMTQLVVTKYGWYKWLEPEDTNYALRFEIRHPGCGRGAHEFLFAEHQDEAQTWYQNSLPHALNVAYWFQPKKIIMLGFDWGGLHFFGDGSVEGCQQNYGIGGTGPKAQLNDKLILLNKELCNRGMKVYHVGPTQLDVFNVVGSIQEALDA